jgi:molybdopterin-guanine dinucleotide biosynthesis protein A
MKAGAVVLAGGRSSRMGEEKALLDWHGRTAVEHAVAVVREGIGGGPVCVVRAPGQRLPALDAIVVEDAVAYDGPLAALHVGLGALVGEVDVGFACGVDTPLLAPAFVRAMLRSFRKRDDAVVPIIGGRSQPLLAAYRVAIAPRLQALLDDGAYGLREIPRSSAVRQIGEWELISDPELDEADPRLDSALNANTPEEWAALVEVARRSPASS